MAFKTFWRKVIYLKTLSNLCHEPCQSALESRKQVCVTRVAPGVIVYGSEGEIEKIVGFFGLVWRGTSIVLADEEAELEEDLGNATTLGSMGAEF